MEINSPSSSISSGILPPPMTGDQPLSQVSNGPTGTVSMTEQGQSPSPLSFSPYPDARQSQAPVQNGPQQPLQNQNLSGGLVGSIEDMLVEFLNKLQNLLKMVSGGQQDAPSSAIKDAPQNIVGNSSVPLDTPNVRLANVNPTSASNPPADGDTSLKTSDPDLQKLVNKFGGDYEQASKETGVPAKLLASVTMQESGGDIGATSTNPGNGKTDTGMNQINPDTYAGMRKEHPDKLGADINDPKNQIMCTALMLKEGKEKFGSYDAALRAYNSGDDQVDKNNLSNVTIGDPNYVKEVNGWMSKFH